MNERQRFALTHHCRLAFETAHPGYIFLDRDRQASIVLTVNSGYECLEQDYGGAVWHSSAAPLPGQRLRSGALRMLALRSLADVGDRVYEWDEWTSRAYHVRRRLTPDEQAVVGAVLDLRGTEEGWARWQAMRDHLPEPALRLALEELGP
jgi:hypothetical protein